MVTVESLGGLWRRSLLALPDGTRDETSAVSWLQGGAFFVDLRQPAGLPVMAQARGLDDLSWEDCAALARQQGFAGRFRPVGDCFEWVRELDFWPPGPSLDIGRLAWQGEVLVEVGRDVPYVEHWHRDAAPAGPCGGLRLRAADGAGGFLVRCGGAFMYARGRARALLAAPDLAAIVAAAADVVAARALLDCEISQGEVAGGVWRIGRSSLPFRMGDELAPRRADGNLTVADRRADGAGCGRVWEVVGASGDVSTMFDVNS